MSQAEILWQTERWTYAFESILQPLARASLSLPDGTVLSVHTDTPEDIGGLAQTATTAAQYLKLQHLDCAILNDPYDGGTHLGEISLVLGVSLNGTGAADFLFCTRLSQAPRLTVEAHAKDEGLRIPPMPIMSQGRLNREMLTAIASQPGAPFGLERKLLLHLDLLLAQSELIRTSGLARNSDELRAFAKVYIETMRRAMHGLLGRLPQGQSVGAYKLEAGPTLKLRTEAHDHAVFFDFSGSDSGGPLQLTELSTLGACFAALSFILGEVPPINSGTLSCVQISSPAGSIVSAKAPASTARGLVELLPFVCEVVRRSLVNTHKKQNLSESSATCGVVEFDFGRDGIWSDLVPGGTGATADLPGLPGFNHWRGSGGQMPSIEKLERELPLLVRSVSTRTGSAGRGKTSGGAGVIKSFECLKPARLRWLIEPTERRANGAAGGKAGLHAEIVIQHADGEKLKPSALGEAKLNVGDIVRIGSAGGGGFGDPES